MGLVPGVQVEHPTHGAGVVARVMDGGRKALVRFERRPAVPRVVPAGQLTLAAAAPPAGQLTPAASGSAPVSAPSPAPSPAPQPGPQATAPPRDARVVRQTLEALRLGVVPSTGLAELTVGRHEERARIAGLLDEGRGMMVLSGGYGAGKTHMIEVAEEMAHARGFLVARATFDPVEVPPSHPLRLYGALLRDLRHPGGGASRGLRPLLERLPTDESLLAGALHHRWLSPALFAVHHAPDDLTAEVLDFVAGQSRADHADLSRRLRRLGYRGPRMLGLPDYRTFGQIMAHLLGGLAAWSRAAGQAGLVVLLDEAEYLDRLGATARQMAENVLRYLAIAAMPPAALGFEPGGVYRGGQATHRRIDPVFRAGQPLVVLCAFTPNPDVDRVLGRTLSDGRARLVLEPLRPSLLPVLAEKVYGLVKAVYPALDPDPRHRQRIARALSAALSSGQVATTRQAARLVVEFWDLYRHDPARALRALHGVG